MNNSKPLLPLVVTCAVGAISHFAPAALAAMPAAEEELEAVLVVAERDSRVSRGATGLDLAIKDTPQSISVVDQALMRDFGASSVNDALRLATGINVEEWETDRSNYMARGFDIVNTQVDGVGMPNEWGLVTGDFDAFGFEKLEVIRGANGQLTGVGNSSGTINYVRKRPTNRPQATLGATLGSHERRRIETDHSTPFTASGSWAGRFVTAWEEGDSYLQLLHDKRLFLYAVVDGQAGERTTAAFGYSFQDAGSTGNTWGGLPFAYSDGTQATFARNATTSQDWTRWDTRHHNAFAEASFRLAGDWTLKSTWNYRRYEDDSLLFYAWAEAGLDPATNEGVVAYPGAYGGSANAHFGDVSASGHYTLFGRMHEVVLGIAAAWSKSLWDTRDPDPAEITMPAFPYPTNSVQEPAWGERYEYERSRQKLRRAYGATRLSFTERLNAIVGFNYTWFRRNGVSIYDEEPYEQEHGRVSPYAGLTFDLNDQLLAYASYSDIYQPQDQRDINFQWLDPTRGVNYELGVKGEWFDRRLLTTLALFAAEQRGLSTFAGYTLPDFVYYYEGVDVNSRGVELEATGRIGKVNVQFGFTALKLDGAEGPDSYPWTPRRTARLAVSAPLPSLPQMRVGFGGRWQSKVENFDDAQVASIRQDAYAVFDAFASWKVNEQLSLQANVENLANEKYINSVYYVGTYGAPRQYSAGLQYRFR